VVRRFIRSSKQFFVEQLMLELREAGGDGSD